MDNNPEKPDRGTWLMAVSTAALFESLKPVFWASEPHKKASHLSIELYNFLAAAALNTIKAYKVAYEACEAEEREAERPLMHKKGPDFVLVLDGVEHTFTELNELTSRDGSLWFSPQ